VAIIPVKDMPWVDIIFRSVPRLAIFDKKVELTDTSIAYYGEIKCVISKTTIFGKMRDKESLFAPIIGELDLGGYKLEDPKKEPKSEIYSYISAVINSLDSTLTRSQLEKYHEGYQRHGEPICDFLMSKKDLLEAMENDRSGLESDRIKSNVAVCSIAIPLFGNKSTLMLVIDDGDDKNSKKFTRCFEALLKFSATCCEAPTTKKAEEIQKEAASQQLAAAHAQGSQELKSWTEEELAAQKKDATVPEGMAVWTEEELLKSAEERSAGVPEGMEVWTEKELEELARKRQGGGLDIPEWIPDSNLVECSKCGYSLKKSWTECPICGTKIASTASKPVEKSIEESKTEDEKEEVEKEENEKEEDESKEVEEKVEEEDEKKEDESNLL
ncbi:MAG TPA: zinc ribbon domain-containing protein, partial [Candidatus Lokiarchaeia archaeon]